MTGKRQRLASWYTVTCNLLATRVAEHPLLPYAQRLNCLLSESGPSSNPVKHTVLPIVGVALTYFVAAYLGLKLQIPGTNSSPVWPPTGIAFAAVLLLGFRVWPGIMIGAFAANFLVFSPELEIANKLVASVLVSVGNTLESTFGVWLLYRLVPPRQEFDSVASVFKFVTVVLVMCLVSCTIGATAVCGLVLPNSLEFSNVWMTWWLGDVAGGLILTPAILAWVRTPRPEWSIARWLEAAALLASIVGFVHAVFGQASGGLLQSLPYLLVVGPLWAAFRFGLRETTTAALLIAVIAVFNTMQGAGPFLIPNPGSQLASLTADQLRDAIRTRVDPPIHDELIGVVNNAFLMLQIFVSAIGIIGVTLSAAVTERNRSAAELRELNVTLESRVVERTEELAAANQALALSNEELDAFAYTASHDLKEPIRGVANYTKFLAEDYGHKLDDEFQRRIGTIQKLCKHMDNLVSSLLTFSRVGRVDLAVRETDLNAVVNDILDSLGLRLEQEGIEIRMPAPLPHVVCDSARIGEVFRNLITNAIKYNDKAQKWIEIGSQCRESAWELYVRDNGIGIREKHLDRVFEMFKRLHAGEKYGGGTGAGLTIVQKIVERHRGTIRVESTFGEGTTFYFTLGPDALLLKQGSALDFSWRLHDAEQLTPAADDCNHGNAEPRRLRRLSADCDG